MKNVQSHGGIKMMKMCYFEIPCNSMWFHHCSLHNQVGRVIVEKAFVLKIPAAIGFCKLGLKFS